MANIKFTQLPNQGLPTDATIVPTVASGTNYTITGANLKTYVNSTTGNITGGNLVSTGAVTATGTVTGGNITTGGVITAAGNITGNYIFGNGSQLTGISVATTYGNANVNSLLSAWGSNALSTTGNVTAGYVTGNGSLLSNLNGANVTGTVPLSTSSGYATNSGLATSAGTAGTVTTAAQPNITSVGTLSSLSVTGNITSGANISAAYFLGNGSGLTGIVATSSYGNANVAAYLPTYTGAMTAMTGALTTTANITGGNLVTAGNVTGSYIKGNGSQLTGTVTSIVAGSGISVNVSTGAVTVTATGGGSGGTSINSGLAFVNANATTASGGNIVWMYNGDVSSSSLNYVGNSVVITNQQGSNNCGMLFGADGNINFSTTVGASSGVVNIGGFVNFSTTVGFGGTGASAPVYINSSGITSPRLNATNGTGTGVVLPTATAAVTRTYVGQAGSIRAVSDSPTYAGRMCYWSTTATAGWRYIDSNAAV
jgi:hypothetical protein